MDWHFPWCYLRYLILYSFSSVYTITDSSFHSVKLSFQKKVIKRMDPMSGNSSSSYSCINCGTRHNQIACPNCGSKMKRAEFHKF